MADEHERGEPLNHAAAEWTVDTLAIYSEALRKAEERFQTERDRRYAEVKIEEEKALKIKEEADARALVLASENQRLRDAAHNELLTQWRQDRSTFASRTDLAGAVEKLEALIKPSLEWVAGRRGRDAGGLETRDLLLGLALVAVALIVKFA
jgi:hypothetical protein